MNVHLLIDVNILSQKNLKQNRLDNIAKSRIWRFIYDIIDMKKCSNIYMITKVLGGCI